MLKDRTFTGPMIEEIASHYGIDPHKSCWFSGRGNNRIACAVGVLFYPMALPVARKESLRSTSRESLRELVDCLSDQIAFLADEYLGSDRLEGIVDGFDGASLDLPRPSRQLARARCLELTEYKIGYEMGATAARWLFEVGFKERVESSKADREKRLAKVDRKKKKTLSAETTYVLAGN